jgi:hypothetical protein
MGNWYSTTPTPVSSYDSQGSSVASGVRITGSAIKSHEQLLQDAYDRGKSDQVGNFDKIAAQVFEHTSNEIVKVEQQALEQTEKKVSHNVVFCFYYRFLRFLFLFLFSDK